MQSSYIGERISRFGNKLYLEFGGKLFDDHHASRVLPGFAIDSKVSMLGSLAELTEIVVVINSTDIDKNKVRGDFGITYDSDVLRLIDAFRGRGLYVGSVVITQYSGQDSTIKFKQRLEAMNVPVFIHHHINDYPTNIEYVLSEEGFGKNDYIETSRPLVVVTSPGPGSGKMATCLSQLYHEHLQGRKAGYAKFETFPVWNLPLSHPVNLAYEAATIDLSDVNMVDPFHLEHYGEVTVNYNRDIEVFPILREIFRRIWGECYYNSPTDMGVNMAGNCISDNEVCIEAARQEIVRRYYQLLGDVKLGNMDKSLLHKMEMIMKSANAATPIRKTVEAALTKAEETKTPCVAIELADGKMITGKTSYLLGASSAALLNALKYLADINDDIHLLSPIIIEPIQKLKVGFLGNVNPRLHTDEVLIALSVCAATNPTISLVLEQLPRLRHAEAHSSVILSQVDVSVFKNLGINVTSEPTYENKKLYHKN